MSDFARATSAVYQMDWRRLLITNKDGSPRPLIANALTALRNDPAWAGVLAFNEFAVRVEIQKRTPWGKPSGQQWTDNDARLTAEWLQRESIPVATNLAGEAAQTVARERIFHPVRDYLASLRWDKTRRLYNWTKTYVGAQKPVEWLFGRLFLISAVARVLRPGCKVDTMLVLEGPQGIRKSTAFSVLAGQWFSDRMSQIGSKDSLQECHGVWILEHAELDSLRKSEASAVKSFMTSAVDRFRLPYGHAPEAFPRQCVFAGSTNKKDWLDDETGGRRFWPVSCVGMIDIAGLTAARDQLWAEAVEEFHSGKSWWLSTQEEIQAAEQEQSDRYRGGVWDELIEKWLQLHTDVSVSEVLEHCIGKDKAMWTQTDKNAVARALRACGWEQYRIPRAGTRRYRRNDG